MVFGPKVERREVLLDGVPQDRDKEHLCAVRMDLLVEAVEPLHAIDGDRLVRERVVIHKIPVMGSEPLGLGRERLLRAAAPDDVARRLAADLVELEKHEIRAQWICPIARTHRVRRRGNGRRRQHDKPQRHVHHQCAICSYMHCDEAL